MTNNQISALIYATAVNDGMPDQLSRLILAQAFHETDSFTSHAFLHNNNCFGYKFVSGAKWQMGKGIGSSEAGSSYADYKDVESSIHELTDWIKRRQFSKKFPLDLKEIKTPLQYASLLKACNYFGDSVENYAAGLIHFSSNT